MSTPIADQTAHDIATTFTYGADRVQMYVVDESTVLAVGFRTDGSGRATGRVSWIRRRSSGVWTSESRIPGEGFSDPAVVHGRQPRVPSAEFLSTDEDLKALVVWLRGDA